jgi:hypothetical protein
MSWSSGETAMACTAEQHRQRRSTDTVQLRPEDEQGLAGVR